MLPFSDRCEQLFLRFHWKNQGLLPLDRKWFKFITSVEESKELNDFIGTCVILAGSGMCNGGRIQHHLKFSLSHPTTQVLFVGYQGHGSLGRQLVDGAKQVKIHGEKIDVHAAIHTLSGLSAHAGQSDLLRWFDPLAKTKPKVLLTHGENPQREALAAQIEKNYKLKSLLPQLNEIVEI